MEIITNKIVAQDIAIKADIVCKALLSSNTLSDEHKQQVFLLMQKVKTDAGVETTLGESATEETIYIINGLRAIGKDETANQVEQMLSMVQQIWTGE